MNTFRFYLGEVKDFIAGTTRTQRDIAAIVVVIVAFLIFL